MTPDNKNVEVCSECKCASCWYGEFMCEAARGAGTEIKTVGELRTLNRENEKSLWTSRPVWI